MCLVEVHSGSHEHNWFCLEVFLSTFGCGPPRDLERNDTTNEDELRDEEVMFHKHESKV